MYYYFIIIIFIIIFYHNSFSTKIDINNIIKILIRQSARWSIASMQDKNPLIAVLHANYGAAYLWALKDITNSEQIKNATDVDVIKFQKKISEIQDIATKRMVNLCPEYSGNSDKFLAVVAGEN